MLSRFTVRGALSPALPLRILDLFAQRDLVCSSISVLAGEARYDVTVTLDGLGVDQGEAILHKLRSMVLVEDAQLAPSRDPVPQRALGGMLVSR